MLKTILSVSGRPGLFRLISSGKNMVIVESLEDKRKLPIYARDKVVSLGDIAMYTDEGEVALGEILGKIHVHSNGKEITPLKKTTELQAFFTEILPTYDKDRVHDSDIKKLITWYNLLIHYGLNFQEAEQNTEATVEVETKIIESPKEEKEIKKEVVATKKKTSTPKKKKTDDK